METKVKCFSRNKWLGVLLGYFDFLMEFWRFYFCTKMLIKDCLKKFHSSKYVRIWELIWLGFQAKFSFLENILGESCWVTRLSSRSFFVFSVRNWQKVGNFSQICRVWNHFLNTFWRFPEVIKTEVEIHRLEDV